jgi:hypothetical protein
VRDVLKWHAAFKNFSWSVTYIGGVSYRKEVDFTSPNSLSCDMVSLNASTLSPILLPIAMYVSCTPPDPLKEDEEEEEEEEETDLHADTTYRTERRAVTLRIIAQS